MNNTHSVHLTDFPVADESLIDKNLEKCMSLAQQISSMILALRRKADKKVRQPLSKAVVPTSDETIRQQILYVANLIKSEVNIKSLEVLSPNEEIENLVKKIKPNFKTLGKRYGKLMKEIALEFTKFDMATISKIEESEKYLFTTPKGESVELHSDDYEIVTEDMPGWLMLNEGNITVALDIEVTEELIREGIARELVNRIQNIRKSNGFEITDRIVVKIQKTLEIDAAVEEYAEYIATQTLANKVLLVETLDNATDLDFDSCIVKILVEKV